MTFNVLYEIGVNGKDLEIEKLNATLIYYNPAAMENDPSLPANIK
jgi:hypothetical protein